jgi:hypothetical protein
LLRNAIEHIFGVLKRRFRILLLAPEYNLEIQARIPAALCAVHNFIREHDPNEGELEETRDFSPRGAGREDEPSMPAQPATAEAGTLWDQIAEEMWEEYQRILVERGTEPDDESSEYSSSSNSEM